MEKEAQRAVIAKACGWGGFNPEAEPRGYEAALPDYLNDLNAMHAAEATFTPEEIGYSRRRNSPYTENLGSIVGVRVLDVDDCYSDQELFMLTHATAAQRAEAFLRTKGLWVKPDKKIAKATTT